MVTSERFAAQVRDLETDILLNIHSLRIVHPEIVEAPGVGSFNLHPGPLPELAGLNVPSWAVYLGHDWHAVTLHWMQAGIDTGPIAYMSRFDINDQDTGLSVSNKCVAQGVPLIDQLLDTASENPELIPRIEQDLKQRRYYGRRDIPFDGHLDWAQSANDICAFVRACDYGPFQSPWGRPDTSLDGVDMRILRVRKSGKPASASPGTVVGISGEKAMVSTADEDIAVLTVEVDERTCPASDMLTVGQTFVTAGSTGTPTPSS